MKTNDLVIHKEFGIGKIIELGKDSSKIKFDSLSTFRIIKNKKLITESNENFSSELYEYMERNNWR